FIQRAARTWTIVTGYAMPPQLAMAVHLMFMIRSSLLFLRRRPGAQHSAMQVTDRGTPPPNRDQLAVALDGAGADECAPAPPATPAALATPVAPVVKAEPKHAALRAPAPEARAARSSSPAPVNSATPSVETTDRLRHEAEERSFA